MTEALISRTTGTHFGNLTELGGIAASFDGSTVSNNPNFGSYKSAPATTGYIGTTWSTGKKFSKAIIYGWNDRGFLDNGNGSITITIYGKNGTPSSGTDGTSIGTLTFTDTTDESAGRTIISTDTTNTYTSIWAYISGTATGICVAELVMYELTNGGDPPPPPPPPNGSGKPLALFLLWGQSHMVGWAPIQDQSAYRNRSRIKTFLNGQWVSAADPLSITSGPFEFGWMGCGMPMAETMSKLLPDYEIAPVVRAHGATSINEWVPGSTLLTAALADWHAALSSAPLGSFIAGMGSWQGESDNGDPSGWVSKRLQIGDAIKTSFGLSDLPDVIICCSSRWGNTLAEQLAQGLPKNTNRIRIDDKPAPAVGDIIDPGVYRVVGERLAYSLRSLMLNV